MNPDKIITVFGATGIQGNAVAKRLLQDGWKIRAVTRDAKSAKAQALSALGADIVTADFDDFASLVNVLENSYGVYSVQPALTTPGDVGQARWGIAVADAAWTTQVQHFVYASAVIDQAKGIPGLGSKRAIEERIAELSLPATILRPVFFMENLTTYFPIQSDVERLTLSIPFPPNRKLQMVAVADIAKVALSAFSDPQTYVGQAVEIVGDAMTLDEMAAAWENYAGRKCSAMSVPLETLAQFWSQGVPLFRFIGEGGCDVNITVDLEGTARLSFSEWLHRTGAANAS
ncbi:NmrA/HSCARG family protein [Leptolyngbya sp. AN03gr2]|uniref:NmrA/HSCARG family protein n=1 Tax=unclassified Leptolyngbya TaxID=2650499 RepID=UPI003D3146ED